MNTDRYQQVVDYMVGSQEKFYRLAYSYVHSQEAALDIVQNVTVKALENYSSIRDMSHIKTWFYRILVNESISYIRKNQREQLYSFEELPEAVHEDPDILEGWEMAAYVERLPEKVRTVIVLRYYEEMTLKEIAEITGTNLNTVKYRLYSGLKKLETYMKEAAV